MPLANILDKFIGAKFHIFGGGIDEVKNEFFEM